MIDYPDSALTRDAFLGGKLHLYQPRQGYRAGLDAVLLAASVQAKAGESVLELGCGVGTAILCLNARVPGLTLTGVELLEQNAALARRNGGDVLEVVTADLTEMPLHVRQRQFDHVLANPPYFDRGASVTSEDQSRESAHGEHTPLHKWIKIAGKRLAPKGCAYFIHRAERLPDLIRALPADLGSVEVLPLAPRAGRNVELIILRARKNGRAAFRLHHTFVMHVGAAHGDDGDRYTPALDAVLREGAAFNF
ncbi:MAG: methyltransferase domain-containing protein [Sulfitobacter sp.]